MSSSTIRILREVNNYTQEYVAEKLEVSPNTYAKLEQEPSKLRAAQAEKLAELYGVGIGDILSNNSPNITFSNNDIENNFGYIQNYQLQKETIDKVISAKDSEIESLRKEIDYLRSQNKQLLDIISNRSE